MPRPFAAGQVQVNVQFADKDGRALGYGHAVGSQVSHEVTGPRSAPTLLQVAGKAPEGTARVMFYVQVRNGKEGEVVTFDGVAFHHRPRFAIPNHVWFYDFDHDRWPYGKKKFNQGEPSTNRSHI